ncbi:MAG: GNAT family N-acetyltransferase [Bacteroidetes bacterium]|nr:GNAT family N-acetyltransferase [Bacteroidota bacterium]
METTFRDYHPPDFEVLKTMIFDLYSLDGKHGGPMTEAKIARTVEKFTGEPNRGRIFIFEKQREIAGYAIVNYFWSNEFGGEIRYIDELYVQPAFRNAGLGSRFFSFLEKFYQNDAVAFSLETTKENQKATALYRRLGFHAHHNFVMFKQLSK